MKKTMTKSTPPLVKHQDHQIEIRLTHHHNGAFYHCLTCQKHVAWLSKNQVHLAKKLGII